LESHCKALNEKGQPCQTPPSIGDDLCFWHNPKYENQAAEARRAGGANHAREQTLKAVFAILGVKTIEDLQRVVDIATVGLLTLDNSVARNRALLNVATTGARLIEVGELAAKIEALGSVLEPRMPGDQKKKWWGRK
jgi:hypothetical protein